MVEPIGVQDKITGLAAFCFGKRPQTCQLAKEILLYFIGKKVTASERGMFAQDVADDLKNYPPTTVRRMVACLEGWGFLDRKTKYDGYFLSHTFLKRMEKNRSDWRDCLNEAERAVTTKPVN